MKKTPKRSYILLTALLLPMALMTVVFLLCGLTPFGSRSLGVLDMSSQYLSFLGSLRDLVTGRASFLYLPSLTLGGNMTGIVAYYLMSPLNLLTCLFPLEDLLAAVSVLFILRTGLCGLTMAVYTGSRHGWSWRVLFPALAYGFMGYMTAYSINYQWHDCVIMLPLVALGIARLAEGRGWALYAFSLAAALALNFYVGYILCLFSVLFFLYELLTGPGPHPGRALVRFILASLAAGAMAMAALLPAAFSLMGGKASLGGSELDPGLKFSVTALFSKLIAGSFRYNELTPAGLPNIFSGAMTCALASLYFADRRIPRRRRVGTALLLGALVISFLVPVLDLVWHGMNVPTWFNYRYSFLFCFLLIAAADRALAGSREGMPPRRLALPMVTVTLIAALALMGAGRELVSWSTVIWTWAAAAVLCAGLYLLLRPNTGKRLAAAAAAVILLVHGADLGLNAKLSLDALTETSSSPSRWSAYVSAKAAAWNTLDTGDGFIRAESPENFDQNRCEDMLFGYDGISHYGSTIPEKDLDFLQHLGVPRYRGLFCLYGPDVTAGTDSFLGIKYLVAGSTQKPYGTAATAGDYTIYENPYALPVAWTADEAFASAVPAADPFSYLQGLYDAAAPETDAPIYAPAEAVLTLQDMTAAGGGLYTLDGSAGSLTYTVTPTADGPLYGVVDIQDYPGVVVFVNDRFRTYYANGQANGTLYLGDFSAGEPVTVLLQAATDLTISGAAFATENADALADHQQALEEGFCPLRKLSPSHFTGTFTTGTGDSLLVLTIPYDTGWHITLDGETVQAREVQGCLTAIPVTAGEHTLAMRYRPPGLLPGACISLAALTVCVILARKKRRGL